MSTLDPLYAQLLGHIERMRDTPDQRASVRCGLGDAAAICHEIARQIESRGRASIRRGELAETARRCGDAIMEMYHKVRVHPPGGTP
jgi:hypothetical protein